MFFWIFVIALLIGMGLLVVSTRNWDHDKHPILYYNDGAIATTGAILAIISAIIIFVMLCGICITHISANADLAKYQETHKALTYKLESGACRDEFGLLNKTIIDEIQDLNENIVRGKSFQKDFWVGIFYPNIYDELKTIDYTNYVDE